MVIGHTFVIGLFIWVVGVGKILLRKETYAAFLFSFMKEIVKSYCKFSLQMEEYAMFMSKNIIFCRDVPFSQTMSTPSSREAQLANVCCLSIGCS